MPAARRLALAAVLLATFPATAGASAYSRVLHTYEARGSIPSCAFTGAQLAAALKGVDVYGQQYFSDFTTAIQSALSQRAAGACAPGRPAAAAVPARGAGTSLRLRPVTAATGAGLPLPLLALAAVALLLLLASAGAGVRRRLGYDLAPGGAWWHLWAEAGWRAAAGWADLRDWMRLSRRAPRPRG